MGRNYILPLIVISQLFCTSMWFAGNAVVDDIREAFQPSPGATGLLTSAVQLGFIVGTLVFAVMKVSDRFSPSRVFMISAILGAFFNGYVTLLQDQWAWMIFLRFLTGFFLAGIYPVGMKIASDYHQRGLGLALGYLVGALVIGTASPHLFRDWFSGQPWQYVMYSTSILSVLGGLLIGFGVPDGPYRKKAPDVDFTSFFRVFLHRKFRAAAFGYFGHMWELYAFWAFVPSFIVLFNSQNNSDLPVSLSAFSIIAIGGLACLIGGYLSNRFGSNRIAFLALLLSFLCCLISPLSIELPPYLFMAFLLFWGMAVITDSPQFSALVARHAPTESVGTALTIVNSVGFAITIGSLQLLNYWVDSRYLFLLLAPGPLVGLITFYREHIRNTSAE